MTLTKQYFFLKIYLNPAIMSNKTTIRANCTKFRTIKIHAGSKKNITFEVYVYL